MPRLPKIAISNTVIFITTSVEEGLFFTPNPLIRQILLSCLAKAQQLYPIKICHFIVMSTHIHILAVVQNPDDVKDFMKYFKTESAHAINRLLGRKKRTIWCEGYDSPIVLDVDKVIDKIAYIYANPSNDNLVDCIEEFPGLSSWCEFLQKRRDFKAFLIARHDISPISKRENNYEGYSRIAKRLCAGKIRINFNIDPNCWLKCFDISESDELKLVNDRILDAVREKESKNRERRKYESKTILGTTRLMNALIGSQYHPEREGKKTICIGSTKEVRMKFIEFAKALFDEGRRIYEEWKIGNINLRYPWGLYPPSLPKQVNLLLSLSTL